MKNLSKFVSIVMATAAIATTVMTSSCTKKDEVGVTSVTISSATMELKEGESATLTATIVPDNASNANVNWSSSDESVVTVNNGIVKGVKFGTATITAMSASGGKTATCSVTVKKIAFDDSYFNTYVFANFDTNHDNAISPAEAAAVTEIDLRAYPDCKSVAGVEIFTNLKKLYIETYGKTWSSTTIDVSKNTALEILHCTWTTIETLDVSKNINLIGLYCSSNHLSELDITHNQKIEDLWCGGQLDNNLKDKTLTLKTSPAQYARWESYWKNFVANNGVVAKM